MRDDPKVIQFPANHYDNVEALYFDLMDAGCTASVVISSLNIMSICFELEPSYLSADEVLKAMARVRELFEGNPTFKQRFFEVALSYGSVFQEFGAAKPIIDFNRTIDDVRREIGIAAPLDL